MSAQKRQALRRVGRSSEKAKMEAHSRNEAIRNALEDGCSIREVAIAAELSPARIHQIRHGK